MMCSLAIDRGLMRPDTFQIGLLSTLTFFLDCRFGLEVRTGLVGALDIEFDLVFFLLLAGERILFEEDLRLRERGADCWLGLFFERRNSSSSISVNISRYSARKAGR